MSTEYNVVSFRRGSTVDTLNKQVFVEELHRKGKKVRSLTHVRNLIYYIKP